MKNDHEKLSEDRINQALRMAGHAEVGLIDSGFLCQSVSLLNPMPPISVRKDMSVKEVMRSLKSHRMGCVTVEDENGKLVGIFSERDYVLKVYEVPGEGKTPIEQYMTKDPVTIPLNETLAHALSLMSEGGFRHLPITDDEGVAIGLISVKDVIDHIVRRIMDDMLNFPTEIEGIDV